MFLLLNFVRFREIKTLDWFIHVFKLQHGLFLVNLNILSINGICVMYLCMDYNKRVIFINNHLSWFEPIILLQVYS